jgi:hypothetical protein
MKPERREVAVEREEERDGRIRLGVEGGVYEGEQSERRGGKGAEGQGRISRTGSSGSPPPMAAVSTASNGKPSMSSTLMVATVSMMARVTVAPNDARASVKENGAQEGI